VLLREVVIASVCAGEDYKSFLYITDVAVFLFAASSRRTVQAIRLMEYICLVLFALFLASVLVRTGWVAF
jgi:hypothetical protein